MSNFFAQEKVEIIETTSKSQDLQVQSKNRSTLLDLITSYVPEYTLPEFNMELENDGFRKKSTIPGCLFQVPC